MTDPYGFLSLPRAPVPPRPVEERLRDWDEVYAGQAELPLVSEQARRCMDCGIPFCHHGCPLANLIPEWNILASRGDWQAAHERLHATNNFPEFTGRLCPAPCEDACVLAINTDPVTIKNVEQQIADTAWERGHVVPYPPERLSGKTVAVVGSGPAGLAAAQQLTRIGHTVAVYERADRIGGLLRYGIPSFKLAKDVLDRRLEQMRAEGTRFRTGVEVGGDGVSAAAATPARTASARCCGRAPPPRSSWTSTPNPRPGARPASPGRPTRRCTGSRTPTRRPAAGPAATRGCSPRPPCTSRATTGAG
jgi:glutamate synthase (NADPH/NADH) small chain